MHVALTFWIVLFAHHSGLSPAAAFDERLAAAQRFFYNGQYEEAASLVLDVRASNPDDLAGYELRTSALHFQIKRLLGDASDKDKAFKQCATCPSLMSMFREDIAGGQTLARARLKKNDNDDEARFLLGKLDLNHVWLQLGTLGHRTGWDEYWEARHSLDAVLKRNPGHVRARVARAWIDYIVDTKVNWTVRWILGGGNKKRALAVMREAAESDGDVFTKAEAGFALWEMLVREKLFPEAVAVAQRLAHDFPGNRELVRFLAEHGRGGSIK